MSTPGNPFGEQQLFSDEQQYKGDGTCPNDGNEGNPFQEALQVHPHLVCDVAHNLREGGRNERVDRHYDQVDDRHCHLVIASDGRAEKPANPEQFAIPHDHIDRAGKIGAQSESGQFLKGGK